MGGRTWHHLAEEPYGAEKKNKERKKCAGYLDKLSALQKIVVCIVRYLLSRGLPRRNGGMTTDEKRRRLKTENKNEADA